MPATSPPTPAETIIQCPHCGAKNRVTPLGDGKAAVCGRCKTPLPAAGPFTPNAASDKPIEVTDATFAELVERSPLPVLLDLWAPWCGPCRMLAPTIDAIARELAGRVRVAKLNTEDNQATAARCRADAIPLLLIFKGGREVDRMVGLQPKDAIVRRLSAHV